MNKKAVAMLSGGLDSILATKMMLEQGIEVKDIIGAKGGGETVRNLTEGNLQLADAAAAASVLAILRAKEALMLVAGGTKSPGDISWLVLEDSPIRKIQDLKGKTMSYTSPGSVTEQLATMSLSRAGGISPDDVKRVSAGGIGEGLARFGEFAKVRRQIRLLQPGLNAPVHVHAVQRESIFSICNRQLMPAHPSIKQAGMIIQRDIQTTFDIQIFQLGPTITILPTCIPDDRLSLIVPQAAHIIQWSIQTTFELQCLQLRPAINFLPVCIPDDRLPPVMPGLDLMLAFQIKIDDSLGVDIGAKTQGGCGLFTQFPRQICNHPVGQPGLNG